MATFDFNEANGTTLEEIDSKWAGDTTNLAVTNGKLRLTGAYSFRYVRYENSPGTYQSSKLSVDALSGSTSEEQVRPSIHATGTGSSVGYEARIEANFNYIYLYKSGSYVNEWTSFTPGSPFTLEVVSSDAGGGSIYVKVFVDGVERISVTDASPLTGGYPGFGAYTGNNGTAALNIDQWTDGVSGGSIAPLAMANYRMRTA